MDTPQRCQSNTTCFIGPEKCRISNVCSQPGRPYQCPDNQCADRFFNCITKQLECRYKGQTRCPDGYCRRNNCKDVKYSSCPMSSPLLCGSGRCVSYLFQCAGGSYCPLSRPFLCPDMSCQTRLERCTETRKGGTFPPQKIVYPYATQGVDQMTAVFKASQISDKVQPTLQIVIKMFYNAFNSPVQSPFSNIKITKDAYILVEPVALHDLMGIENQLNSTLAGVARDFFMLSEEKLPYFVTIRSAAIKVSSVGRNDDNDYFRVPFNIEFSIDSIKKHQVPISNYEDFICLGRVRPQLNNWECTSRKILNLPVGQTGVELLRAEYNIAAPGIYAVIFRPRMTPNLLSQSYCGLICRNKKLIIALCFVILPLIIVLICMCWKYMLLRWEAKEQEEEALQRRSKLMEMEDMTVGFKGEKLGEKMAENMMYNQNPLQGKSIAELDDINRLNNMIERMERDVGEINQVKKDLLAKTKRQIQKISLVKDNIENLGTNRFDQDFGIEYQPKGNYTDGFTSEVL